MEDLENEEKQKDSWSESVYDLTVVATQRVQSRL